MLFFGRRSRWVAKCDAKELKSKKINTFSLVDSIYITTFAPRSGIIR